MMKRALTFLLMLAVRLESQVWYSLDQDSLHILYQPHHLSLARQVAEVIRNESPEIENRTGFILRSPVKIFITQSDHLFDDLTRNHIPDWGAGVTDPAENLILLKSRALQERARLQELVIHEFVHILTGQNLPGSDLPRWFEEGIAVYLSRSEVDLPTASLVSRAMLNDQLVDLDDIEDLLRFRTGKARLAYAECYLAFEFLVQNLKSGDLRKFLNEVRDRRDFSSALKYTNGKDWIDFQISFFRWLDHIYRWYWLVDLELLTAFSILLVCIGVLIYIKKRNRAILAVWEMEEANESDDAPES